jgi:Family of unknown function (DUF5998)
LVDISAGQAAHACEDVAMPLTDHDQAADLREALDRVGYYPDVVAEAISDSIAGEAVTSWVLHHEPTFDGDEVRRHLTVLLLTPSRLIVTHTDEHPPDDVLPEPYASTSAEQVALAKVSSVVLTRMVTNPAETAGVARAQAGVSEAVLTIGWGAVARIDLEPATCGDPQCEADHGYQGAISADDFSMRMSATADGADDVGRLLEFARALSAATARPT